MFLSERIRKYKRMGGIAPGVMEQWALEAEEMERKLGRIQLIANNYDRNLCDLDQRPVKEPEDFEQLP